MYTIGQLLKDNLTRSSFKSPQARTIARGRQRVSKQYKGLFNFDLDGLWQEIWRNEPDVAERLDQIS